MQDINTVVTFSSRTGAMEKLALAAALGAVQAKSYLRLRWLREDVDDAELGRIPGWGENRVRMAREYIAPREIDLVWADVLILGMPAREGVSSPQWHTYISALQALHAKGSLRAKVATAFTEDLQSLCPALENLGLIVIPPDPVPPGADAFAQARRLGRILTEAARDFKRENQAAGA